MTKKSAAIKAHKECCPYRLTGTGVCSNTTKCKKEGEKCNGDCWYVKTFIENLKKFRETS